MNKSEVRSHSVKIVSLCLGRKSFSIAGDSEAGSRLPSPSGKVSPVLSYRPHQPRVQMAQSLQWSRKQPLFSSPSNDCSGKFYSSHSGCGKVNSHGSVPTSSYRIASSEYPS